MNEVAQLHKTLKLGMFRVRAAPEQVGIYLGPATCGRILVPKRSIYGFDKQKGGGRSETFMPVASERRDEYWTAGVRCWNIADEQLISGKTYAIMVVEDHSRVVLASAVSTAKDPRLPLHALRCHVKFRLAGGARQRRQTLSS